MAVGPMIEITDCRLCGWGLRAGWMAQELLTTFAEELGSVTLTPDGTGGVFEVRVNNEVIRATTVWKFGKMGNFNMKRRRWRGPALGGPLQRGARYCFAAFDGEATTAQLTEWCRPKIVYAGGKPTAFQMVNQCTALRSIGAKRIRREGRQWVWRLKVK